MDNKTFGKMIYNQRKKLGLTQNELAEKLHIGGKAVSKWENGMGYPEITLLAPLSDIFGVPIDYLIKRNPRGIAVAGSIVVDVLNVIEKYPKRGMLTNVLSSAMAVGGCVPNVLIDLAKLDRDMFLTAFGCIGNDEYGKYAVSQMKKYGIDTSRVEVSSNCGTSVDQVMTAISDRERTFFYSGGTNKEFCEKHINLDSLDCEIFHIGYLTALDELDKEDCEFGTRLARLLKEVQGRGIKTSIDVVSNESGRFAEVILPSLKYCDFVIVNEIECCKIAGVEAHFEDGSPNVENIERAMRKLMKCGNCEKIIVHFREGGMCLDRSGELTAVPSLKLPKGYVKGSVGAGDAFAAASLYGLYRGFDDKKLLEFASAAAACNLSEEDSVSGMKSASEVLKMCEAFERRDEFKLAESL